MNLKELEKLLLKHLEESGEIRSDLKWLKRAFWVLTGAGVSFNFGLCAYMVSKVWGN